LYFLPLCPLFLPSEFPLVGRLPFPIRPRPPSPRFWLGRDKYEGSRSLRVFVFFPPDHPHPSRRRSMVASSFIKQVVCGFETPGIPPPPSFAGRVKSPIGILRFPSAPSVKHLCFCLFSQKPIPKNPTPPFTFAPKQASPLEMARHGPQPAFPVSSHLRGGQVTLIYGALVRSRFSPQTSRSWPPRGTYHTVQSLAPVLFFPLFFLHV